jgi:hypothetical protein
MKQTAVEQLLSKILETVSYDYSEKAEDLRIKIYDLIISIEKQALEMEKEQIIEAHGNKKKTARDTGNYQYTYTGEMYFNDNYY